VLEFLKKCAASAALFFAFASAHATPLLINGGFETGDFSGWMLSGSTDSNVVDTGAQHGEEYSAYFGQAGMPASITQTLSTQVGHSYVVSFWLANLGGSMNNPSTVDSFEVRVGGNSLLALSDKTATEYMPMQVQFNATTDATDLAFFFRNDETYWLFDDVAISEQLAEPEGNVPEPATMLMLMLGIGLIKLQRRRS
jgi:hypothetical protein